MNAETHREIDRIQLGRVRKLALVAALVCGIAGSRAAFAQAPGGGAARPQFVLQTGHTAAVVSVAFSPDGKLLASGSDDTTVILWNVQTGQMLCTLKAQNGPVRALAFSPNGKLLATGSTDGTVILWDAATGQLVRKLLDENRIRVTAVAFSPDSQQVSAALQSISGLPSGVKIWDAQTGQLVNDLTGAKGLASCGTLSPDGKKALTGPSSGREAGGQPEAAAASAIVRDAHTGASQQTLEGAAAPGIASAAFSADGKLLAMGAYDSTATLWDTQTGKKLQTLKRHTGQIMAEAFSQDGLLLATGSQDGSAILWDTQTGERILTLLGSAVPEEYAGITAVAFSPNGRLVATGNYRKVILWNAQTGQADRTLSDHNIPISSALFSPDGKQIGTVCDRTAVFWDATAGKRVASTSGTDSAGINSLAFSADGSQAVTTSNQTATVLWDARTGQKIRTFEGYQFPSASVAAFSPDGKQVAMLSAMRNVVLWDAQNGSMLRTIPETPGAVPGRVNPNFYARPSEQFSTMAFSADGKQMLTTPLNRGAGGGLALWDVPTGHKVQRTFAAGNNEFFSGLAFRPGGKEVAAISASGDVTFWDAQTGKKLRTLLQSADPAPGPTTLADRRAAERVARQIEQQQMMAMQYGGGNSDMGRLASFAFSPDGKQVVIGSVAETASLWNAETGKKVRELKGHCRRLASTPFSKDGRFLVGVGDGGAAGVWDASTGELAASLLTTDGGNEWMVVTPEGFFDGSPRGRRLATFRTGPGLKLVIGDKLGNDFYRPGLLTQILAGTRPK